MATAPETIWVYDGWPNSYHDLRCRCDRHCRHCFDDLDQLRVVRAKMIKAGTIPAADQLGPREKYCSPYCRGRAKRERAFDRYVSRNSVPQA